MAFLEPVVDRVRELTRGMGLTNDELAQMVIDTSGFILSIQGLTGVTTEAFDGFAAIDESAPAAKAIKSFLKERLRDFEAAGTITREELNNVGK